MKNVTRPAIFKWRQTAPELILCAVRWYLRYSLSLPETSPPSSARGLLRHRFQSCNTSPIYHLKLPVCGELLISPESAIRHTQVQYLNNILEQDHRAIKRRVKAKQSFREFQAARRTIDGYEAMHMIRKGQARWVSDDDVRKQNQFIDQLFDLAA